MTDKQETVLNTLKSLNLEKFETMKICEKSLVYFKISKEFNIRMYRIRLFQNGSIHVQEHYIYSEFGSVYTKDLSVNYRFGSVDIFTDFLKEKIES